MRALGLSLGLALPLLLLSAALAGAADPGELIQVGGGREAPATETGADVPAAGRPTPPSLNGGGTGGSAPGAGEGVDLSEQPSLDLGPMHLDPDVGLGIALGVGLSIAGLAAASLLGTRFVTNENVLENDARRAIFEYIKANPGCHLRETAGALQLSTTNVLWHLRKLEDSNLVSGKKLEGYKVFYPVEGGVEAKRMGLALAVLRNPNAVQILGIIARNPGIHQREIARMLMVNHGTVRWHLKKLNIVQLVLEVKKGSVSQYYVSALGLQALERAEARPPRPAERAPPELAAGAPAPLPAEA